MLFNDSLFRENESHDRFVPAHGIIHDVGFHPSRLVSHRAEVATLVRQLPDSFHSRTGGGMSFLNFCTDNNGILWGEQSHGEMLVMLGEALGMIKVLFPRQDWKSLPGGVPYYVIDDDVVDDPCSFQVVEIKPKPAFAMTQDTDDKPVPAPCQEKQAKPAVLDAVTQRKVWLEDMQNLYRSKIEDVGVRKSDAVLATVREYQSVVEVKRPLQGKHKDNFRLACSVFKVWALADTVLTNA